MNKKEIIEEVVVSDSASTRTSTNNTLRADGAVGGGCSQTPSPSVVIQKWVCLYSSCVIS